MTATVRHDDNVPEDLAAGPAVELWADPDCHLTQWSVSNNWADARDQWAADQGLELPGDYRHLPRVLF